VKLAANLSLLYPGLDLPARMQAAARDGFEGVEILFPYDLAPQALAEALQCNGLALALINTPPGPNGEKGLAGLPGRQADFRAGLQQALDVCRATGCRAIHVMAGAVPEGQSRPACLQALADNLRQAAPLAAERGVTLTLEALNRHDMPGYLYWLPQQAADVVRAIDHPNVGLQFDLYHCQKEGLPLPQTLAEVRPLVRHVQFAGADGRHEPDLDAPGVAETLQALARSGYDGWIGCEYLPAGDTSRGLSWRAGYRALLGAA
jgi:Hydroxypyruvate isomerase